MSCGIGHRCSSDPTLLQLWHRPVATAPIRPLAWEPPYAMGVAQEKAKRQQQQQKKRLCLEPASSSLNSCPQQGMLLLSPIYTHSYSILICMIEVSELLTWEFMLWLSGNELYYYP